MNDLRVVPDKQDVKFLEAAARLILDNADRLQNSVDRITKLVLDRVPQPDVQLVVAFQDFDRLKQELDSLAGALVVYSGEPGQPSRKAENAVNSIVLSDMRTRFTALLGAGSPALAADLEAAAFAPAGSDEKVY